MIFYYDPILGLQYSTIYNISPIPMAPPTLIPISVEEMISLWRKNQREHGVRFIDSLGEETIDMPIISNAFYE